MLVKKRKPWIAVFLSFLCPGLGQLYAGRVFRAFSWLLLPWLLSLSGVALTVLTGNPLYILVSVIPALPVGLWCASDAFVTARRVGETPLAEYQRWYVYTAVIVLSTLMVGTASTFVRANLLEAFNVPSTSMTETLLPGDHILVNKLAYRNHTPQRNDIVVFRREDDPITDYDESIASVKRIVAVGGDRVEVRGTQLLINDNVVDEPFATWVLGGTREFQLRTVPEGEYFLLGDNRDYSKDCRYFPQPFIPESQILGRVESIYWPWERMGIRFHE